MRFYRGYIGEYNIMGVSKGDTRCLDYGLSSSNDEGPLRVSGLRV